MNPIRTRPLLVLVVPMLFAVGAGAARASAAAAVPAAQTQTVVGGGIGTESVIPRFASEWEGHYTTASQLGNGTYQFGGEEAVTFTRSDGMTMTGTMTAPSPSDCGPVEANVECSGADLAGTADIASAHLTLWIATQGPVVNQSVKSSLIMRGTVTLRHRTGYVMVDAGGNPYTFGGIDNRGGAPASGATDVEVTPSGKGYWILNADGRVASFGNASPSNAVVTLPAGQHRFVSISSTPSGRGYWLFMDGGIVYPYGDAKLLGNLEPLTLNSPIVDSVATPSGKGYYMVARDGGVFAFGDARFHGSMGGKPLNQPVVGIVSNATNDGYWLVAADGGVFAFNAPYLGSMGGTHLNRPVVGIARYGHGYLLVARDGGIFNFSKAPFFGSTADRAVPPNIVSAAAIG